MDNESFYGIRLSERLLLYLSLSTAVLILGYVFGEMGYPYEQTEILILVVSFFSVLFLIAGSHTLYMRLHAMIFDYSNISSIKSNDLIDIALVTLYSVVYLASFPMLVDKLYMNGSEFHISAGTLILDLFSIMDVVLQITAVGLIVSIIVRLAIEINKQ